MYKLHSLSTDVNNIFIGVLLMPFVVFQSYAGIRGVLRNGLFFLAYAGHAVLLLENLPSCCGDNSSDQPRVSYNQRLSTVRNTI